MASSVIAAMPPIYGLARRNGRLRLPRMRNPRPQPVSTWWRVEMAAVAVLMLASAAAGIASLV
jgi:hypothetical protein